MKTWHIHIKGQVQGVGFRPFVYRLAKEHNLCGWVCNTIDGLHIEINACRKKALFFYEEILIKAPPLATVTDHRIDLAKSQSYTDFQIIHSKNQGDVNLLLTPDFSVCENCSKELLTQNNRRFHYPFITCTNCGPRFSITRHLPYDRERTTMDRFQLCSACKKEYHDPENRRYFSQTNSCPVCTIELSLVDADQNMLARQAEKCIKFVTKKWHHGKIVAIKGIGGYLLTCDAYNTSAIVNLRKRKHRPRKPFAVMYPNLETLSEQVHLQDDEKLALTSTEAPIVILENLSNNRSLYTTDLLAPGLDCLGVMLPYTPLYKLLLKEFGKPIVATSANVSNSPIIFQDEKALTDLSEIADYFLINNREIVVPQDDSVIKFSRRHRQKIILRRSRGIAPNHIQPELALPKENILSTGAMLKSTFTFHHQGNTFISQYLGDLESFDTQESYRQTINHFFRLFDGLPQVILTDKHPQYFSTIFGEQLAKTLEIPIEKIQHHIAHFAAGLGEHNLLHSDEPVLGIIWDGTGLGDDRHIWGGEFFQYKNYEFSRYFHLSYFDLIQGDKMSREPRLSALSTCWEVSGATEYLKPKFTQTEWKIYLKKLEAGSPIKTSSVGRLFDAVASLLGFIDRSHYEGEAAMLLERMATQYIKHDNLAFSDAYFFENDPGAQNHVHILMRGILKDILNEKSKGFIAAKFHFSLVMLVKNIAESLRIKKLVFSGGVFQNALLVDLIREHMAEEFELFFHEKISPNDENISFGQLICHQINRVKKFGQKIEEKKLAQ